MIIDYALRHFLYSVATLVGWSPGGLYVESKNRGEYWNRAAKVFMLLGKRRVQNVNMFFSQLPLVTSCEFRRCGSLALEFTKIIQKGGKGITVFVATQQINNVELPQGLNSLKMKRF